MFYEIMGEAITAIDGYTGTLPPFERTIVFAPQNPDAFAQSVFERSGIACTVVDANDLEKAKVLGASSGVNRGTVELRAALESPRQRRRADADRRAEMARAGGESALCAERRMNYGFELALVAAGFSIAGIAGATALPLLKALQFRQHAYEDAPQTHQKKTGTPTMGGMVFTLALLPVLGFDRHFRSRCFYWLPFAR